MVGRMYGETLQMAADQIGWRIHIADKVNQNALFKTAQLLCMKAEIPLAKNPSYLPEKRMVQLKIQKQENDQALQDIAAEFLKQTGCSCTFSIQPAI